MTIGWRHAKTFEEAEVVRTLRNAGRTWFHSSQHISTEQQRRWWAEMVVLPPGEFACLLVGDPIAGYGMLRRREGRFWVSLAVDPSMQGLGVGADIYRLLARQAPARAPVYAAIRQDNRASLRAAQKAGYAAAAVNAPDVVEVQEWIVLRGPT
jgi:GNAT superfamily N-acetyltransferase